MLDLDLDPALTPQVALLRAQIEDAAERLQRAVAGLSQPAIEYRGAGGTDNSIASILAHLAVANLDYAEDLGVIVPDGVRRAFGPWRDRRGRLPIVEGVGSEELLGRVERSLSYLRERIGALDDTDLATTIRYGPEIATIRWCLWHVADHLMEHLGQIRALERKWSEAGLDRAEP